MGGERFDVGLSSKGKSPKNVEGSVRVRKREVNPSQTKTA